MAKLRSAARKRLKAASFAYPKTRKYPIHDLKHARNALARAASSKNSGTYSHVARAVRRKYGNRVASVGPRRGTTARPGYRRKGRR